MDLTSASVSLGTVIVVVESRLMVAFFVKTTSTPTLYLEASSNTFSSEFSRWLSINSFAVIIRNLQSLIRVNEEEGPAILRRSAIFRITPLLGSDLPE